MTAHKLALAAALGLIASVAHADPAPVAAKFGVVPVTIAVLRTGSILNAQQDCVNENCSAVRGGPGDVDKQLMDVLRAMAASPACVGVTPTSDPDDSYPAGSVEFTLAMQTAHTKDGVAYVATLLDEPRTLVTRIPAGVPKAAAGEICRIALRRGGRLD